jgi:hypothetical protein
MNEKGLIPNVVRTLQHDTSLYINEQLALLKRNAPANVNNGYDSFFITAWRKYFPFHMSAFFVYFFLIKRPYIVALGKSIEYLRNV